MEKVLDDDTNMISLIKQRSIQLEIFKKKMSENSNKKCISYKQKFH